MNIQKNNLAKEDVLLFNDMENNYTSINEENFFKNMKYKQEHEVTALNDLIVSEYDNDDEIYIVRECYEEYVIGHGIGSDGANEKHLMCLSDALSLKLNEIGFTNQDMTVLDWLRKSDYIYVKYNRNYDLTR